MATKSAAFGDLSIHPATQTLIRDALNRFQGAKMAAYQNHDLGHPDVGGIRFLAVGPGRSHEEAPDKLDWRYLYIGDVIEVDGNMIIENNPKEL